MLGYSGTRASTATLALSRDRIKDARAWFTASLAYQYDCWGGLKYVNDTVEIRKTMSFMNDTLIVSTSNALRMVVALDDIGSDPASWTPPRTKRTGFWEKKTGSAIGTCFVGFGPGLRANATVCKAAGCDHATVQQAVEAAPANLEGGRRYVIHIKKGVYEEIVRVGFEKKNLVFLGDGIGKTVITGPLNTGLQGITTYVPNRYCRWAFFFFPFVVYVFVGFCLISMTYVVINVHHVSQRVSWSSLIPSHHVNAYSPQRFLLGY